MEIRQSYLRQSAAAMVDEGLQFDVSTDLQRPGVTFHGIVRESLAYGRLMLSLYEVVSGDQRAKPKDHAAYQRWVQERYLEELPKSHVRLYRDFGDIKERQEAALLRVREMQRKIHGHESGLLSSDFIAARGRYYQWLLKHDRQAWMVLDPVVSVHPDCVVFEVFSLDESSYGRVTVPTREIDCLSKTVYGTTNVDYSRALADEFERVRSYRPAFLKIGGGDVSIATSAGERVEKKIDLPPTWVRGFLQVQSAATFPSVDLTLSSTTLSDILAVLRSRREDKGPRSLRFALKPGEFPSITVEPWDIVIRETEHRFQGNEAAEVRVWGRRRLLTLQGSLPYVEKVGVRLLGTGMPSYWSIEMGPHRLDLGLSGWTKNDWSRSARFDMLSSTGVVSEGDVAQAAAALESALFLTPQTLSERTDLVREAATVALQRLCREGRAMYDLATGLYRWRQLLPFRVEIEEDDERVHLAKRLVATGGVRWLKPGEAEHTFSLPKLTEAVTRYRAQVRGGEEKRDRKFNVVLDLDSDGRARFAECNCSWHRREKLRKGPCGHILAATILASQQSVGAAPQAGTAKGSALRADRFKGQTIVFTGALEIFSREQAEALVHQGGGKTSGSVSKNTTLLVAGARAGSKLAKARELNIPVVSEEQFQAMLNDSSGITAGGSGA